MAGTNSNERMEKIVSLCRRRGFVFQSSEIYGGLNGLWDYGPLGIGLKRNSVVVTPWDEFAVSLDRARRTGLAEVLKQVGHRGVVGQIGRGIVDGDLHSTAMVSMQPHHQKGADDEDRN